MEVRLGKLSSQGFENNSKKDFVGANSQVNMLTKIELCLVSTIMALWGQKCFSIVLLANSCF